MRKSLLVRTLVLLTLCFLVACGGQGALHSAAGVPEAPELRLKSSSDVEFAITNDWGTGYGASVTLFNRSATPLKNWVVEWDFASTITDIWNARIDSHAGQHYRLKPETWNATIPAGGSVSFGFNGAPGIPGTPLNITLVGDGAAATTTPSPTATPAGRLSLTARVTGDWGSGMQGSLVLDNQGASPVKDWSVSFRLAASISSLWNGKITAHAGDVYVVGPESWNSSIPPGTKVEIGFTATPGGQSITLVEPASPAPTPTATPTASPTASPTVTPTPSGLVRTNAYFPEWGIYDRNFQVDQIPAGALDAVTYAFADITPGGEVTTYDAYAAGINFPRLKALKQRNPSLKIILAVGGYTLSYRFPQVAATAAARQKFAASAVQFCRANGFDGIDIDWEYPASATDKANFTALLAELRRQLSADGKLLSAALPASPTFIDLKSASAQLDWVNLMTYDYHGSWEPNKTGHNAPLYAPDGMAADDTVRLYVGAGVPAGKILLGVPIYGRSWMGATGVGSSASGVGPGTWEPGMLDYRDLLERLAQPAAYPPSWDSTSRVPYILTPQGVFISFEDQTSLSDKLDYVKTQGLGGVMFWELSADARDQARSLVQQASRALR